MLIIYLFRYINFLEVKQSISSMKQAILSLEVIYSESGNIYTFIIFIFISTCVKFILPFILGTYKFPDLLPQLYFILGQLENSIVKKNRRRYNMITMILSLKSHLASHSCYMQLRRMDCITLPHESSLKRLYSNFGLDTEFLTYLRAETTEFNELERHLCLNMDEIHVKSNITYKGWFDILVTY